MQSPQRVGKYPSGGYYQDNPRPPYLIRTSLNVGGGTGGHACAGGGGGAGRGDRGGAAGRWAGAVAGAELGAGAGASLRLTARCIGALSFIWACPIYRSNSWSSAWRRGPLSTIGSPSVFRPSGPAVRVANVTVKSHSGSECDHVSKVMMWQFGHSLRANIFRQTFAVVRRFRPCQPRPIK
jgi:hypothetical protein